MFPKCQRGIASKFTFRLLLTCDCTRYWRMLIADKRLTQSRIFLFLRLEWISGDSRVRVFSKTLICLLNPSLSSLGLTAIPMFLFTSYRQNHENLPALYKFVCFFFFVRTCDMLKMGAHRTFVIYLPPSRAAGLNIQ